MTREEYVLHLFASMDTKEQDDILFIMESVRPWQKVEKFRRKYEWLPIVLVPIAVVCAILTAMLK